MHTISLKARADQDGVIRFEIPTQLAGQEVEVLLVIQPLPEEPVDDMGYPVGYFEETYGSFANDPLERNQPPYPDMRDTLE